MPKKSPISKRLKEARLEAELSQMQLGVAIGIDQFVASPRMNQYETGKHVPDFNIVEKIANVLKLPAAFFYAADDELAELLRVYGRIGKNKRRQLLIFAKQLQK